MVRVGVFICHCGTNIAGVVDIARVLKDISGDVHVHSIIDHPFMCSDAGQKLIKEHIKEKQLDRIVIAACSPRLHEDTFRRVLGDAGLNPYLLEIANIREQCSWPHHEDPQKATSKAIWLIKGAIHRALALEEVGSERVDVVRAALVIGGGVAGIQAALDLAEKGIKVYLVEREPVLGGNMAKHDKVYPTMDCSQCILSPKMAEAYRNENIDIYTLSEVIDVDGHVGDFKVRIRRKPRYVDVERCTACNICYEKCPSRVPDEYHHGLGFRKAIYIPYKQAIPRAYLIDTESCLYFQKGVCRVCEKFCPAKAIDFDDEEEEFDIRVGAIIAATGFKEFDPSKIPEYGYGKYKDVLTNMQLTSLIHPDGPTSGRPTRPSDGREADDFVFIQCVGSRDERFHRYCSRVCCMASLKLAYLIKSEKNPAANIYICYIDLRAYGKGFEEYLERVKSMGVKLVRGKPSEVTLDESSGKLLVRVYDTVLNEYLDIRADIVSLAAAIEPSDGSRELAKILGIDIGPDGFYKELHPKLEPVSTKVKGIYICGAGWGPADIPESVAMAKAAASESASLLSKGHVKIPLTVASVDVDRCDGCGICIDSCSYGAVELKEFDGGELAVINELACSGCGSCASACPTGAIELRHYRHEQILRQIEGMLGVVE